MFGGMNIEQPTTTGKRISGFATRKEPSFNLGWDQSPQLNSFQIQKRKGHEITTKVTSNQAPSQEPVVYDEALEKQKLQQLYEKLAYENPDIPPEEIQKYVNGLEQERKPLAQQPQSSAYEKRTPIKQKESMRDIIYNGASEKGLQSKDEKRTASRRNNSNLVLGDGYNYFQQNRRI